MQKTNIRIVAATVALALGASGCEYLGPRSSRKIPLPRSLMVEKEMPAPETKPVDVKEAEPLKEPEYYPARGGLVEPAPPRLAPPAKEGRYTLNFDDADVGEVAKAILGDILKVNYVINPKVAGKVSLQTTTPLSDDQLIPTLEMILRTNGAVLIRHKGLYRIEPDANAAVEATGIGVGLPGQGLPSGYQLRIVPLRYVGVAEMQKVIEPLMPPKSIIRADEARNLLVIAGSSEELENVLETIRLFDVDFMRGMSVALFPLKNVDAQTVAEELEKLMGGGEQGPLGGLLRLLPIERLNAILAVTPQSRYLSEVESWVERLDRYNTAKAGGVHVYRVQNVDAVELAETLSNIFGEGAGTTGAPRPSLAPGQRGTELGSAARSGARTGGGFGGSSSSASTASSTRSATGSQATRSSGLSGDGQTGSGLGTSSSSSGLSGGGTGSGFGSRGSGSFAGSFGSSARDSRGSTAADLGRMKIVADPANNALVVIARAQDWKQIESVIKDLDVMPLQVLLDATIAEVTLTGNLEYGLSWFLNHHEGAAVLGTPVSEFIPTVASGGFAYSLVTSGNRIRVTLRALAEDQKVNILSSPSLMVLNNQEASIKVGRQVPIRTSESTPTTGSTGGGQVPITTSTIQYRDTGVLLNLRPRVNAGGLVIMDVEQAFDDVLAAGADTTGSDIDSPGFLQRQIKSSIAIKDRDTIVLGGLISQKDDKKITGIPWLSQIPIIGSLFGSTKKTIDRTELVVLITPRVVHDQSSSRRITNEFRRGLSGLEQSSPSYGKDESAKGQSE